uniref:MFS transporter n=1 Tax=Roseihalotalea indica TaxID=2867963 RepID=A0AA49JIS0_9BACT|nr:MFS transporter [Tunicatimonas sp. TK19036]
MTTETQSSEVTLKSATGRWVLASTILASSMAFIDSTALNVILPSLQQDLQAKGTDIFWILNAYLLMLASLILVSGSLGDKLGRKKVFMVGIAIFMAASTGCGLSTSVEWLVISRLLQGIGGALMIPGSLSLLSATFHRKEKGRAIGTWSAVTTLMTVGGPLLGGALGDAGLWRFIFYVNIPLGMASLLMLYFKVPESVDQNTDRRLDYSGAFTIASGLALLTYGCLEIPEVGWGDWKVYVPLGLGVVCMLGFLRIEKGKSNPMIPLYLFKNRTFAGANLLTFLLYTGLGAAMLFLSLNLIQVQGYRQLQAGMVMLPFTVILASFARWAGSLTDRYGPRWLLVFGSLCVGSGFYLFSRVGQTQGPSDFWTTYLPGVLVFGLGMAFTVVPLTTTVMGAVEDQHSGVASGVSNSMTRLASVFANAVFGALAIVLFSKFLIAPTQELDLLEEAQQAVYEQAPDLGAAKVPESVPKQLQSKVENAFHQSFIKMYQQIMFYSAVLAWLSALVAFFFIDNKTVLEEW